MTTLLSLDTASEYCSVCLYKDGIFYESCANAPQKHAEIIIPMIDDLLKKANVTKDSIDAIAFGRGPGSFTGVRIGVSAAQALALGLDVKLIGISNLKALCFDALKLKDCEFYVNVIDARMNEVYLCIYKKEQDNFKELILECVVPYDKASQIINETVNTNSYIIVGTGAKYLVDNGLTLKIDENNIIATARSIMEFALIDYKNNENLVDASLGIPTYVRNEVTWKKISEQK